MKVLRKGEIMKQMKKLTLWLAMAFTLILMVGMSVCAESKVLEVPTGIYQDGADSNAIRIKFEGKYAYLNYQVQMSVNGTTWQDVQPTLKATQQAIVEGLETGRTYFIRMRSYMQGTDQVSEWTQPYKVSTCPGNITSPVAQTGKAAATAGTISWGAAAGATGYEIWYSTSIMQQQTCIATTTATSYTLTGLAKDASCFVSVVPYTDVNVGTAKAARAATSFYQFLYSGNDCYVKTLPAKVTELQTYEWGPNSKNLKVAWKEGNVADGYELVFYNDKNKKVKVSTITFQVDTFTF